MQLLFRSRKLQKQCSSSKELRRTFGVEQAIVVEMRLSELRAAANLAQMRYRPRARCHELKAEREGQLSVDLKHPYRLVFMPAHEPLPKKLDGGLEWEKVTEIIILEVVDYHG